MRKLLILLCLFPFLAGCATARAVRYSNIYYPPTDPNTVGVYYNFPPGDYEVIGEVEGSGAPAASWEAVGKFMRDEAAKIGGDAVVIQQTATPYVGTYRTPGHVTGSGSGYWLGNSYYQRTSYTVSPGYSIPMYGKYVRGVVIKFKSNYMITKFSNRNIINCPKGHAVDVTGFPPGTDVECPICNEIFKTNYPKDNIVDRKIRTIEDLTEEEKDIIEKWYKELQEDFGLGIALTKKEFYSLHCNKGLDQLKKDYIEYLNKKQRKSQN